MSELRQDTRWTWDAYLEWEARQELRHELVDGRVRAMTGGTVSHDMIANNLRSALLSQLRGSPCRLQGPDLKIRAGVNARYPDALIDCGPRSPGSRVAHTPVAVFEVLSKSTAWIDQTLKLRDYDATETIRYYVLISQDEPRAVVYRRDENRRLGLQSALLLEGQTAAIDLPDLRVTLPFADLYREIDFGPV